LVNTQYFSMLFGGFASLNPPYKLQTTNFYIKL